MKNLFRACLGALLVFSLAELAFTERTATVKRAVDGDTVILDSGEKVRLLGIDAPESSSKSRGRVSPAQPFGNKAGDALRKLVDGKTVRLRVSTRLTGRYNRTLAYLYLADGTDVQVEMLRQGLAITTAYPPDLTHFVAYRKVEKDAMARRIGMWNDPYYRPPQEVNPSKNIEQKGTGPRYIKGVITAAKFNRKAGFRAELTVNNGLRLLINRAAWEEFWHGRTPQQMVGKKVIAGGRLSTKKGKQTMWITHRVMLEVQP